MRLLLGSGGYRTPERVALIAGEMQSFFGSVKRLLFVPYALADHDGYVQMLYDRGLDAGFELVGIHTLTDPRKAVEEAEAVYVGGGNSFRLLATLYRFDLVELIRERVLAGLPYMGVSAGTNMACPTLKTTNDMPIVQPPSFEALNLIPFQINPHYYSGDNYVKEGDDFVQHHGETRDDRIREFHEENVTPVVGLWEAGIIRCEDSKYHLTGTPARLFRKDMDPVDLEPDSELSSYFLQYPDTSGTASRDQEQE